MKSLIGALVASVMLALPGQAADYPERTITLIVPFAPGGSSDIVGRLFAQKLEEKLDQRVVIENVGGAGGTIGAQRAATAPGDGYTLFVGSGSELFIYRHLNPAPSYDTYRDFAPVGMLGAGPMVLMARPDLEASSFAELAGLAPEGGDVSLSYGSAGIGTFMHIAGEAARVRAHLDMEHVPYRGAGPLMVDVVGSQVDLGVSSLAGAMPFIRDGQGKALAVTSAERSALIPDVPALSEQTGLEGFDLELWIGLFAPSSTPLEVVSELAEATNEIVSAPDFGAQLEKQGMVARPDLRGEVLGSFIKGEDEKYRTVVVEAGIKAE
ncbi:Bug family tripartite tricarboxylate transporter substrate binding protein [Antarcticirhabdus aurantiaca]|nr:tripartite tricarboxylate transporter substrate binding protein [Antarcticirhabdus aurantiaca]